MLKTEKKKQKKKNTKNFDATLGQLRAKHTCTYIQKTPQHTAFMIILYVCGHVHMHECFVYMHFFFHNFYAFKFACILKIHTAGIQTSNEIMHSLVC